MKTPCIAACKNNQGICSGCHRTMSEIIEWRNYSDEQRQSVIDKVSGKISSHQCPSCGEPAFCDSANGNAYCWCFELEARAIPKELQGQGCLCRKCLSKLPVA